jgi:NAD(P)-dependent dehydrogenase (short-subunit alcohol dehydrogenase family)
VGEWQGRTAVVTGGGRGFGKAFGHALAAEGADVVLIDVDEAAAEDAASGIRASGGRAQGVLADVTEEARIGDVMAEAAERNGGIDLLVNNAGLHSEAYNKPIAEMGVAKVRRLFEVNVIGMVVCTLAAWPHMRGREGANVVSIASSAAHQGVRQTAYGNSKLAVAGMTLSFASELGADGIRVNAISPGLILTDTIRAELSPENKALARSMQLIDADGAERDVVEALLYLAGPRARFVTGETLRVTGGMSAGV